MLTMLNTIVVALAATLLAATSANVCLGQTRDPGSILASTLFDPIPQTLITDNIDYTLPKVLIGWNWGAPPRQAAIDMRTNVHHFASPFTDALPTPPINEATFVHLRPYSNASTLVPGVKLIFDPSAPIAATRYPTEFKWFHDAYFATTNKALLQFSHSFPHSLIEGMGMRFQPELDLGTNPDQFTPRPNDQQKAIFGFLSRSVGTSPTNTADPNFNRWVLRKDDLAVPTTPEVVLSDSWPDNEFAEWPVRVKEHQSAPFNGRRMYVAINLRRLAHSTDQSGTTDDAEPVLRLRINRLLCDNSNTWARLRFDSIPRADLTGNWVSLPTVLDNTATGAARGRKLLLDAVAPGPVDEIVITRQMLPHFNDADGSDITILAHLIVDGSDIDTYEPDVIQPLSPRRNPLFLRPQNSHGKDDCGSVDPKHKYIRKLSIEVEYAGNADVAIDWIDLGTENYTFLMQGYYDREARAVAERELTFLDLLNDNRADLTANRARITRWYSRDEGSPSRWQAMRHYHLLFDSRSQTELGSDYYPERYTYMLEPDFIWEGKSGDVRRGDYRTLC